METIKISIVIKYNNGIFFIRIYSPKYNHRYPRGAQKINTLILIINFSKETATSNNTSLRSTIFD